MTMLVPLLVFISKKDWPCQVILIGFQALSWPEETGLEATTARTTAIIHLMACLHGMRKIHFRSYTVNHRVQEVKVGGTLCVPRGAPHTECAVYDESDEN